MLSDDLFFTGVGAKGESGTSVQVSQNIVIDAGNLLSTLGAQAKVIEHIFLTHSHLDHIVDIPFWIDSFYEELERPLKIYGLKETIDTLKRDIFNWDIWPDFATIGFKNYINTIEFIEIEYGKEYSFDDVVIKPIPLNHTLPTAGYVIKKPSFSVIYATDTNKCDAIWEEINTDKSIDSLIIDVSFPSDFEELAYSSKHLTPKLLKEELGKLTRDVDVYITHIKPSYIETVKRELDILSILNGKSRVLSSGEYLKNIELNSERRTTLMNISTALSQERDLNKILQMILKEAINYTSSEGGTIYLKDGNSLKFKAAINKKLNIYMIDLDFPVIPLEIDGKQNSQNVSAMSANENMVINIPDVYRYNLNSLSFEGVKKFDKSNDYRTKSMLVIPMVDQDSEIVGVMQLINKSVAREYVEFDNDDIDMTTTYSNWAASAITKNRLIDGLEELLFSFLKSISVALANKSQYGYGHIDKVAKLMSIVSKRISKDKEFFPDISYNSDQLKELEIAALMHDIGKITTPEYVIDKATKLETIYDRVTEVEMRFRYIIEALKRMKLEEKYELKSFGYDFDREINRLESDIEFIKEINQPSFLDDTKLERLKSISSRSYMIDGKEVKLLSENEFANLSIRGGTLTHQEREKINEHAKVTYDMLSKLNFPKKYSRVQEIACAHHEKLDGSGYPMGLKGEEISFEARVLAVIDIFEALTATDRPYKKPKTKEQTFRILYEMAENGHIDKRVVDFIDRNEIYEEFVQKRESVLA